MGKNSSSNLKSMHRNEEEEEIRDYELL